MGCVSSKNVVKDYNNAPIRYPSYSSSLKLQKFKDRRRKCNNKVKPLEKIKEETQDDNNIRKIVVESRSDNKHLKKNASGVGCRTLSEGEHVDVGGWPAWLSAAAGEAVDGWLPLKSDNYERLEKIGQGTYSNVYRARDLQTCRIMALKKVRFDNLNPESIRFMAREIKILRALDHPNVMKLEGIITSKLSCTIYLVFEYMEHDLSGLISCPNIKFTDSQIKCYMWQLLKGMEYSHSRGVLHRDIKSSNILINNEGVLKIADFGLANFCDYRNKQPLTNRVVTLWYRPPELLLGATSYGPYVDMWSVGCVFAEFFSGRPILKGRTEVEQVHKIFKLCGPPPDSYWKNSKLPLAPMFKSQCCYQSSLRQRFKDLPKTVVNLLNALLSVEPENRLTARSALQAEYFYTKPYQCDPSSMPTYPPNKEINAKFREATQSGFKKTGQACGGSRNTRKVNGYKTVVEDMNPYFLGSRDPVNSETVASPARASYSRFMWEKRRQEHLQRHQSLLQPDYLNSSHVYKPKVLSYDHREREIPGHAIMLDQLGIADVRQLEYYICAGVHRSHSSKGIYKNLVLRKPK